MLRAVIIEDEQHCIDRLGGLLTEAASSSIHLLNSYQTIEDGLQAIRKLQPDVVFLDVQIQERTGFDLLMELKDINFEVIFTTAYERYAVQAFKFSAVDYLLKPVDVNDLTEAINRLNDKISKKEMLGKLNVLLHNFKDIQGASKKISVPTINGFSFLAVNDIIRCQSDVNYTTIYLKENQKLTVAKTLKEFEELLTEYNFYRIHNSHLINLAFIKSYNKGKGGYVSMIDNSEVEVSTRRKEDFLKRLAEV
jgi:two-component system, LytTR family, response regulator